ncbi:phospholipase C/P1 nuclease family protein [Halorussus salinus]|uniref:hypothetical protein n=1 Tax=Halorussus salinus TaxID=1364935 RepID=UPI001092062B|nr:hypothetical protein [Halorussus salinus]
MSEKEISSDRRRTVLKALATSAAVGATGAANAAAATDRNPGDADDRADRDVKPMVVDDSIKRVTPHDYLLTGDKDQTLAYVESADVSTAERKRARGYLHKFWRKYPVRRVETDEEVRYKLDGDRSRVSVDSSGTLTSDAERRQFEHVADVVSAGGKDVPHVHYVHSHDHSDGPSTQWAPTDHDRMIEAVCKQMGVDSGYANVAGTYGGDPDDWGCQCDVDSPGTWPDYLEQKVQDAVDQVFHSYRHYWNPEFKFVDGAITYTATLGEAPKYAKKYLQKAKDKSNKSDRYINLGYASHFLSDAGQPQHTGYELKQATNSWVHYDYESFVYDNWDSGENFRGSLMRTQYAASINDGAEATKELARYSHDYLPNLYQTIYNNPDSWKSNDDVITITRNCFNKTGVYMRGFVEEVQNA